MISEGESHLVELEEYNKKLHNRKLELKGNIRVFCRVRPILQSDIDVVLKKMNKDYMPSSVTSKQKIIELKKNKGQYNPSVEDIISYQGQKIISLNFKKFKFDRVFQHTESSESVF